MPEFRPWKFAENRSSWAFHRHDRRFPSCIVARRVAAGFRPWKFAANCSSWAFHRHDRRFPSCIVARRIAVGIPHRGNLRGTVHHGSFTGMIAEPDPALSRDMSPRNSAPTVSRGMFASGHAACTAGDRICLDNLQLHRPAGGMM